MIVVIIVMIDDRLPAATQVTHRVREYVLFVICFVSCAFSFVICFVRIRIFCVSVAEMFIQLYKVN
jgi:hypothetical protein